MGPGTGTDRVAQPRTVVGKWLLAALLNEHESERRLSRMINGGKSEGWNRDEPAVIKIVCEFAIRRFFSAASDMDKIPGFVSDLRERVRSSAPPGQAETEAVVRIALGDSDQAVPKVSISEAFHINLSIIAQIVFRLGLAESEIRRLIERAERQAFKQGWKPPLYQ